MGFLGFPGCMWPKYARLISSQPMLNFLTCSSRDSLNHGGEECKSHDRQTSMSRNHWFNFNVLWSHFDATTNHFLTRLLTRSCFEQSRRTVVKTYLLSSQFINLELSQAVFPCFNTEPALGGDSFQKSETSSLEFCGTPAWIIADHSSHITSHTSWLSWSTQMTVS